MDDFRQTAIDALTDFYDHVGFYDKMTVAKCLSIVNELPSTDVVEQKDIRFERALAYMHGWSDCFSEHRWIPVTKRKPDGGQRVIVTDFGYVEVSRWFDGRWYDIDGNTLKGVTAWMPLPEPYCGEEMQSTMGQLNDDDQSTKGGDEE